MRLDILRKVDYLKAMLPTAVQIAEQVKLLKENQKLIIRYSSFGDDNWAAIDAQIEVLEAVLDEEECDSRYDEGEWNDYSCLIAKETAAWLNGETKETPMEQWKGLIKLNGSAPTISTGQETGKKLPSSPLPSTGPGSSSDPKEDSATTKVGDIKTSPRRSSRLSSGSKTDSPRTRSFTSNHGKGSCRVSEKKTNTNEKTKNSPKGVRSDVPRKATRNR